MLSDRRYPRGARAPTRPVSPAMLVFPAGPIHPSMLVHWARSATPSRKGSLMLEAVLASVVIGAYSVAAVMLAITLSR